VSQSVFQRRFPITFTSEKSGMIKEFTAINQIKKMKEQIKKVFKRRARS
jgi:hypothetical protein